MNKRKEYITNPKNIIAIIVFIFWLWVAWTTLNNRINKLEEFKDTVNMVEIQATLSSIQKDIERIKIELQK